DIANEMLDSLSSEHGIGILKKVDNVTDQKLVIRFADTSYPAIKPRGSTDDFSTENVMQKTAAVFGSMALMGLVGIAVLKSNNQKSLINLQQRMQKSNDTFNEKIAAEKERLEANQSASPGEKKEGDPKIDELAKQRAAQGKKWSDFISEQRKKEDDEFASKLKDPNLSAQQKADLQKKDAERQKNRTSADSYQERISEAQMQGGLSNTLWADRKNTRNEWLNEKSNFSEEINEWKGVRGKNTTADRESDKAFYDSLLKMTPEERKAAQEARNKEIADKKNAAVDAKKERNQYWKSAREQGGFTNNDGSAMSKSQMVKKVLWNNALNRGNSSSKDESKKRKNKLTAVAKVAAIGASIGALGAGLAAIDDSSSTMVTSLIPWEIPDGKFRCPIYKNPQILGFGSSFIQNFEEGSILKIQRLMGSGAAWLQNPLPSPLNFTLRFKVRVQDAGGVHILLRKGLNFSSQEDSDLNYQTKIMLGVFDNSATAIVDNGEIVAQIKKDQYPAAAIPPGIFTPYWLSYNNGFIMLGFGNPGNNVILSWQDPDPDLSIDRIGFSCDVSSVEFSEMYISPAIEPVFTPKEYFSNKSEQTIPSKTVWLQQQLREPGRGMIGIKKKGSSPLNVILALEGNDDAPQVQFTLGSKIDEPIIVRYKSSETGQTVEEQVGVISDPYESNPAEYETFWISNLYGQFTIGHPKPPKDYPEKEPKQGSNLIACATIPSLATADVIGLASATDDSVVVKNISVHPAIELEEFLPPGYIERRKIAGTLKLISPFAYQFRQAGQSIEVNDKISGQTWYPAKTPQQSATYFFNTIIHPDGDLEMKDLGSPKNMVKFGISAAATALQQAAGLVNTTATKIGQTGVDPITQIITAAASIGLTGVALGINTAGAALQAEAKHGFRDQNAYVFTEKANKEAAGSTTVTPEIQEKRELIAQLIAQSERNKAAYYERLSSLKLLEKNTEILKSGSIWTKTVADRHKEKLNYFEQYVNNYKKIISLIDHPMIINPSIKEAIFNGLFFIYQSVATIYTQKEDLPQKQIMTDAVIELLINARLNQYVLNNKTNDDKFRERTWSKWIQDLALSAITQDPPQDFTLNPMFGEYVWLDEPFTLPSGANGSVFFEAKSLGDIFVGLIDNPQLVRNTEADLYEVVFGGNNNSSSFLRIKSLGRSVAQVSAVDNPNAQVTPMVKEQFWVSIKNGVVSAGKGDWGENKLFEWQDPYPLASIKYIGLSTWNGPVSISNIKVGPAVEDLTPGLKKMLLAKSYAKKISDEEKNKKTLLQDTFSDLDENDALANDNLTQNDFERNDSLLYDQLEMPDIDELTKDVLEENINLVTKQTSQLKLLPTQKTTPQKPTDKTKTTDKDGKPQTAAQQKQQMAQMAGGSLSGLAQEWRQLVGAKGIAGNIRESLAKRAERIKQNNEKKKALALEKSKAPEPKENQKISILKRLVKKITPQDKSSTKKSPRIEAVKPTTTDTPATLVARFKTSLTRLKKALTRKKGARKESQTPATESKTEPELKTTAESSAPRLQAGL
ncbi:hypothetical protein FJ366_02830, partial [Candidatus Dependentiae bacterium]|nr:hypothetical protein [Candidatus Dependentiae bacterium]